MKNGYLCRALLLAALVSLTACTTSRPPVQSKGGGYFKDDGPGDSIPPHLELTPDAQPRIEAIKSGTSKPYAVMGQTYVPMTSPEPFRQQGFASWYGRKFHGQKTASGEVYDMFAMTAAHPTLPLPSYARVTHISNGAQVIVRVNDRGPFLSKRVMDLSYTAALKLGLLKNGFGLVEIELITPEDIRSGRFDHPSQAAQLSLATTESPDLIAQLLSERSQREVSITRNDAREPLLQEATLKSGHYLQLGVFRQKEGAESFRRHVQADVEGLGPMLQIQHEKGLYRLMAGPYAQKTQALQEAKRLREALLLVPVVRQQR